MLIHDLECWRTFWFSWSGLDSLTWNYHSVLKAWVMDIETTVDGWNSAPPGMYETPKIMGQPTYQRVQDFSHQQYVHLFLLVCEPGSFRFRIRWGHAAFMRSLGPARLRLCRAGFCRRFVRCSAHRWGDQIGHRAGWGVKGRVRGWMVWYDMKKGRVDFVADVGK